MNVLAWCSERKRVSVKSAFAVVFRVGGLALSAAYQYLLFLK